MIDEYPRETQEYATLSVYVDHVLVTTFDISVTKWEARPTVWAAAVEVDGEQAFFINGPVMGVGEYTVWARVTDVPEIPVIEVGKFKIT